MANSITQTLLDQVEATLEAAIGVGSGAAHTIVLANFVQGKLAWGDDMSVPGVLLSPVPEMEKPGATNVDDDIGYGVQVTIAQSGNRDPATNKDRLFYWRETAAAALRSKRLTAGAYVFHQVTIEPRPIVDPGAYAANVDATAFVVRCWYRSRRT